MASPACPSLYPRWGGSNHPRQVPSRALGAALEATWLFGMQEASWGHIARPETRRLAPKTGIIYLLDEPSKAQNRQLESAALLEITGESRRGHKP